MNAKSFRAGFFAVVMAVVSNVLVAQQTDTTGTFPTRSDAVKTHQQVFFPDVQTRLVIAAVGVVVLGGLAFFLNAKKKQADKQAGVI